MPYSASDVSSLPSNVQSMSADDRRQWVAIYNSAFARCRREGGDDCEGAAFRQANGVLKKATASRNGHGQGLRQTIKGLTARFGFDGQATELPKLPEPFFEDGDTVWREGLVFRAGDYPDKAYSMTPEEIRAAAAAFEAPVPVDLEHVPTVLDGKLGELSWVQASPDGTELRGMVAMPKWLDQAIGTSKRRISATWNRQTKQLEGLALVLNPRVADAALMAAFSQAHPVAFAEWDTAYVNDLPDSAFLWVEAGDKDEQGKTVPRSNRHLPYKNAQGSIDLPHLRAALSRLGQPDTGTGTSMPKESLMKKAQGLLERANASADAETAPPPAQLAPKEGTNVSGIRERIVALFNQLPEEQLATLAGEMEGERRAETGAPAAVTTDSTNGSATMTQQPTGENPSERRLREQLAASEAENRRIRAERIAEQAAMFADHYIKGEGRAFPAERESIMQLYIQAATDDLLLPGSVTFSDGKTSSRVAVVKAALDARPTHQLTAEQLAPGIFAALVNRDTTATDASRAQEELPPEELRKLIGRTTLGKSVLDHTDRGGVATNGTSH